MNQNRLVGLVFDNMSEGLNLLVRGYLLDHGDVEIAQAYRFHIRLFRSRTLLGAAQVENCSKAQRLKLSNSAIFEQPSSRNCRPDPIIVRESSPNPIAKWHLGARSIGALWMGNADQGERILDSELNSHLMKMLTLHRNQIEQLKTLLT